MQKFDIQAMVRNACGFKAKSGGMATDTRVAMFKCNEIFSSAKGKKSRLRAALSALGPDWTPDFKLPPDLDMFNELVELGLAQKEEVVDRDNKLIVIYTRYRRMPLKVVA